MPSSTWTTLGTIGGTGSARVDGAGRVVAGNDSWSLSWSIGAEDRWHDPAETVNVRQAALGAAPIVETRMRVPGGDIIHRAFAGHLAGDDGGSEWVVIEIENDSAVPVALSLLRPAGTPLVVPRDPNEVRADGTELVFTLTHRATLRALIGITDTADRLPTPGDLPPLDAIERGWSTQTDRGARIVVPDPRLQDALDVTRAYLMVDASRSVSPALATVLDELGLHGDARDVVARMVEFRFDNRRGSFGDLASNAAVVHAMARHQALAPDADFAAAVVEPTVAGVQQLLDAVKPRRLRRSAPEPTADVAAALGTAPVLLHAAGEADAAATVTTAVENLAAIVETPAQESPQDSVAVVDEMLASAGPTWTWSTPDGSDRSVAASVRFAHHVRRLLLDEREDGLSFLPVVPRTWIGQPIEVHDLPTRFGPVSYAVRWHGERPALLWELDAHDAEPTDGPCQTPSVGHGASRTAAVAMTCGLDPAWSSTEPIGETLLAAP